MTSETIASAVEVGPTLISPIIEEVDCTSETIDSAVEVGPTLISPIIEEVDCTSETIASAVEVGPALAAPIIEEVNCTSETIDSAVEVEDSVLSDGVATLAGEASNTGLDEMFNTSLADVDEEIPFVWPIHKITSARMHDFITKNFIPLCSYKNTMLRQHS